MKNAKLAVVHGRTTWKLRANTNAGLFDADMPKQECKNLKNDNDTLSCRLRDLREEEEIISKANAKFACFLKQNSVSVFNDAFDDYLEHFKTSSSDSEIWRKVQSKYQSESDILRKAIKNNQFTASSLTTDEIMNLIDSLYQLKHSGPCLKDVMNDSEAAEEKAKLNKEVTVARECQATASESNLFTFLNRF